MTPAGCKVYLDVLKPLIEWNADLRYAWDQEKLMTSKVYHYARDRLVCSWEMFGDLATVVSVMYCTFLFSNRQGLLVLPASVSPESIGISFEELFKIVRTGQAVMFSRLMPELDNETRSSLNRLLCSPFFNEEPRECSVLLAIARANNWAHIVDKVVNIYSGKKVYPWIDWDEQTILRDKEYDPKFRDFFGSVFDWTSWLKALGSSRFLLGLMARRPPKSILPHRYALLDCIEHSCLFMAKANVAVYAGLPHLYSDGLSLDGQKDLLSRYGEEIMPKLMQRALRIEYILDNVGIPCIPAYNRERAINSVRDYYVEYGADPRLLPPATSYLVEPIEDASDEKKFNWFPDPWSAHRIHGFILHRDVLDSAGFDAEKQDFKEMLYYPHDGDDDDEEWIKYPVE